MKKVLKRIWNVFEILIVIYVIFMTIMFLNKNKYGYTQIGSKTLVSVDKKLINDLSGSKKGDLLIIKNSNNIKNGDLIYYYCIVGDEYHIRYDKLQLRNKDIFIDGQVVSSDRIIGTKVTNIGFIGNFLILSETKAGFLILILLPIFLVFLFQVYMFIVDTKKEKDKVVSSGYAIIDDEII